jgi:hypothetical protein
VLFCATPFLSFGHYYQSYPTAPSAGDDAKRVTQHGYIREMKLSAEVISELAKNKEIAIVWALVPGQLG